MEKAEFSKIWKDFAVFYGGIAAGKSEIYFEAFEYLPPAVVKEVFRQGMKQYTLMPSVVQLEQIRDAVVTKLSFSKPNAGGAQEPAIPSALRASNVLFAKMIIGAHADRVHKGGAYLLEHWPAAFAKFWDSRKRLEYESDCDPYWRIGDNTFYETLKPIHEQLWDRLQECYKTEPEAENPEPEDLPF